MESLPFVPPPDIAQHKQRLLGVHDSRHDNATPWLPVAHYWHPLPVPLAAWYGYVDDPAIGCVIVAILAAELETALPGPDALGTYVRAVPVRTVLRSGWDIRDGFVIVDVPVDSTGQPCISPGDREYRPRPAAWCQHFTGIFETCCRAGVQYRELAGDGFGWATRIPCAVRNYLEQPGEVAGCASLQWPSQEDIAAHDAATATAVAMVVERLTTGRCIECGDRPQRMVQIGRARYAEPCGHRQGVGSARAWNARFESSRKDQP